MTDKPQFDGKKVKVKLADVCTLTMGQSPSSNSYNEIGNGIPFFQGNADFGEEAPVPRVWCTDPKKTAEGGDLLISVRAPIGAVNMAVERCCIGRGVAAIHPNDDSISVDFLKHQLLSKRRELETMGTGSTFKAVGKKSLGNLTLVLYPEDTQHEIERCLNQIKKQIKAISSQSSKLDSLVKSRFVEIFGDFACYETKPLIKCVDCIEAGKSPKCLAFSRKMAEPGVLKLSAISSGVYCENENKALPRSVSLTIDKVVHANDILLSRKNTPELVGRSVLVKHTDGNIMFPDIIFRMHPLPPINAMYLSYLLAGPLLHSIQSLAHGSAKSMSNIPKSELAKLSIPIPALNLQNEFANFVSQVDKSRFGGMLHLLNSLSGIMHASFFSVADTD